MPDFPSTDAGLRDHALEPTMRVLIAAALDGSCMTYGEIKAHLEHHAGFGNIFPTRIGFVAGALMHAIQEVDSNAPLMNVIVVNQKGRMPSHGAGSFMALRFGKPKLSSPDFEKNYPKKWRKFFNRAAGEVYAYTFNDWSELYFRLFQQELKLEAIDEQRAEQQDGNETDFGSEAAKYGSGGEGPHHRSLREYVCANPEKLHKSFLGCRSDTEFYLESGDRVDVVYHLANETIVLEVKSRISNKIDYVRGVYQCIKYRAVKTALDVRGDDFVKAILVTEVAVPSEVVDLMKVHKVQHILLPQDRG